MSATDVAIESVTDDGRVSVRLPSGSRIEVLVSDELVAYYHRVTAQARREER